MKLQVLHQGTTEPCACGAPQPTSPVLPSLLALQRMLWAGAQLRVLELVWGSAGQLASCTHPPNPSGIPRQEAVL